MLIDGGSDIRGAQKCIPAMITSAMACAVAALRAKGITTIDEAQAIEKSYPDFFEKIYSYGSSD